MGKVEVKNVSDEKRPPFVLHRIIRLCVVMVAVFIGGGNAVKSQAQTLTNAQAVQAARDFCASNGVTIPSAMVGTGTYPAPALGVGTLDVSSQARWRVKFPGLATVELVDATGNIVRFNNDGLSNQLSSSQQVSGSVISQTSAEFSASQVLQSLGGTGTVSNAVSQLIQLGSDTKMVGHTWRVVYQRMFQGVPFLNQQVSISLQAETGAIRSVLVYYPTALPPSASRTITQRAAGVTARNTIEQNGAPQNVPLISLVARIVQPNNFWDSSRNGGPIIDSTNAKVAWVCVYGQDGSLWEVWVDAQSGSVIGGNAGAFARSTKMSRVPRAPLPMVPINKSKK